MAATTTMPSTTSDATAIRLRRSLCAIFARTELGASRLSMKFDPAVEHAVAENDEQGAIDDDHAAEQEAVAVLNRVDEKTARAGNVENRFHHDRAGQQVGGKRTEKRNHRQDRDF